MRKIILPTIVFCAFLCTTFAETKLDEAQAWANSVANAIELANVLKNLPTEPMAKSGQFRKGDRAIDLKVDVTGLKGIWLTVGPGGDGTGGDHGAWLEPTLVDANGKELDATTITIPWHYVEWQRLFVNKTYRAPSFIIGDQPFTKGWWAHAVSHLYVPLDGKYTQFLTKVGNDWGPHGSRWIDFTIQRNIPQKTMDFVFGHCHDRDFPKIAELLKKDMESQDKPHEILFNKKGNINSTIRDLIAKHANRLGQAKTIYLNQLKDIDDNPANLQKLLALYYKTRFASQIVDKADEALDFARKTLELVQKERALPELARQLEALKQEAKETPDNTEGDWNKLLRKIAKLRRQIIFEHPALDFQDLLVNKQPPTTFNHQCDQYLGRFSRPGPGLVILKNWKSDKPQEIELLKGKLPQGSVLHPDLDFDARKIAFSFCDHTVKTKNHRRFFIWEINVDGTGLRQLTGRQDDPLETWGKRQTVLIEDYDPCYLPNGNIVFVSTRCSIYGRCHWTRYTPSYLLYLMDKDGNNIRQFSFGEANEWDPSVLHDGRIIYTRWDYINRHDTVYQSLWTTRQDGTGTAHFYGNYTNNPCMQAEARAIPNSRKVIATATAHHAYTNGSIIHIDPLIGEDGLEPLTRLTPDVPFPETEGWAMTNYCSPWPLNEDLTLAAYSPLPGRPENHDKNHSAYGIVLIDSLGGREEIYRDPTTSTVCPIPLVPRPKPPVLMSTISETDAKSDKPGLVYIQNANITRQDLNTKFSALRLNEIIGQPTPAVPHRGAVRQEVVKRVIGTVPVNRDGSSCFEMPSGIPIQIQALDADGLAVMSMRSFIYAQPGEIVACIGCHENRTQTAGRQTATSSMIPKKVTPLKNQDYQGGFNYVRSVQPVLDRYCIQCHGLGKQTQKLNLLGTLVERPIDGYPEYPRSTLVPTSYQTLVTHPEKLVVIAQRNEETKQSKPKDYFAHAGKLAKFLLDGHCKPILDDKNALELIITWLDLNAQCYGDYSWSRPELDKIDPNGEKILRNAIKKRFGDQLAQQPYMALVNVAEPDKSRILNIALPIPSGGWGQITTQGQMFMGRQDPDWIHFKKLVENSIIRSPAPPADGTCGRKQCICGSCWIPPIQRSMAKAK
ncbi:MAG: hypothetical protein GX561_03275 [Lentisphaerae bacterium]|jgi:hypothetical protein|nr:hypothetical protein [Lentisphaerota bacterium]